MCKLPALDVKQGNYELLKLGKIPKSIAQEMLLHLMSFFNFMSIFFFLP